mmetsp:Transcript_32491/g.72251  ORF Transcript_32491/g.72251 Transcript_32491/m.72251 type:complete len:248 (+) Transcript_32491:144-887(+)
MARNPPWKPEAIRMAESQLKLRSYNCCILAIAGILSSRSFLEAHCWTRWQPEILQARQCSRATQHQDAPARRFVARHAISEIAEPPTTTAQDAGSPETSFVRCSVSASRTPGMSAMVTARQAGAAPEWRRVHEQWLFRELYSADFEVLLRKMGYHLSMIYQNVTIACEEMQLTAVAQATCIDCIRHLTSDAYGELGMIIPAHPDESVRGKTDAPTLNALYCLSEGKAYTESAPGAALFCREEENYDH